METPNALTSTEAERLRVYGVLRLGSKIDRTQLLVDARLSDGSRVNAFYHQAR